MAERPAPEHWVCLAGGNALGAFHAGAIGALLDAGLHVDRVAGASIGAILAALWLGGPRETAHLRLAAFWEQAADNSVPLGTRAARQAAALRALLGGRPGLFAPTLPGLWAMYPMVPDDDHIHSPDALRRLLSDLIDFDRLNGGGTRLLVTALDQQTAEDVIFDSAETRLTVDHLMASCALPLIFPPVEIDGRLLVDPGLSANLPVAALFRDPPPRDTLCWAIDLWPATARRAHSPDTVARRAQDLLFAAQSRHALQRLSDRLAPVLEAAGLRVAVHCLGYDGGEWEVAAKGFDFSRAALGRREAAGAAAMQQALSAPSAANGAGLHIIRHPATG